MFASAKEQEFFLDWYERAKVGNFEAEKQFFYFYALFNHLFTSYASQHEEILKSQGLKLENNERSKIKYYLSCMLYTEKSSLFYSFNPLSMLVRNHQTRLIESLKTKYKLDIKDEDLTPTKLPSFLIMVALFMEIYDIRCDLFHGSADLSNSDKSELIKEANTVLDDFLSRLLSNL